MHRNFPVNARSPSYSSALFCLLWYAHCYVILIKFRREFNKTGDVVRYRRNILTFQTISIMEKETK